MLPAIVFLSLSCPAAQQAGDASDALIVGRTIRGEITDEEPEVHTDTLDANYTEAPTVGRTFELQVEAPGLHHVDLRSYFFDGYLVLRDGEGRVLAEDDDGGIGLHARIVAELAPEVTYSLEACALHGQRGAFELSLTEGRPTELDAQERARADRDDAERRLAAAEKQFGPEHPDTATSLDNLAGLLKAQGDYEAARPLYERALSIREKVLGPEHRLTATSLNNLALLLWDQGEYEAARPLYERALAIYDKVLGPEHPVTAGSFNNLALLL